MLGVMRISVQVMANQARAAFRNVEGDIGRVNTALAAGAVASNRHNGMMGRGLKGMTSFGNQLQWTGRQLQYNWTLPLAAATAAGVHFAMENEKAMTRLKKVYGDPGFAHAEKELASLEKAFEALSNRYGVAQSEVITIAADFAAAGSSGIALARQTELAMKTMVLGELSAVEATESLIAIQAQYNQSSEELADTIYRLNNVENQTGTKMKDLIVSMSKSAGVARSAGIDVAHLAAMTAALVPAAGTASQAGNALKTIISRLLSPTGEAAQILNEMGIAVDEMAWKGSNASARIEMLSDKFEGLSDSQKAVVSATLASRYQINKFEVLMKAIAEKGDKAGESMSFYWTALGAATNRTEYMAQVTRELNAVLDSNPRKWEQIKAIMSNSLANVVQPMLPAMMALAGAVAELAQRLSQLDPVTQKWIGLALLMLALVGPLTRYMGSLVTLFATLAIGLKYVLLPLALITKGFGLLAGLFTVTNAAGGRTNLIWKGLTKSAGGLAAGVVLLSKGFGLLGAGLSIAGAAMAPAVLGMWAAVRTSWLIGLTSISSLTLAAFSVLGVGLGTIWTGMWGRIAAITVVRGMTVGYLVAASAKFITAVWAAGMRAMVLITAAMGPTLARVWMMVSISMSVIMAQTSRGMVLMWRNMVLAFEAILLGFAAAAGIIWRAIPLAMAAGLRGPYGIILALTSSLMVAMSTIFAAGWKAIQYIILAGAAAAGVIWRNTLVLLSTITAAWGAVFPAMWRGISWTLLAVWSLTGKGLAILWTKTLAFMSTSLVKWGPKMVALVRTIATAIRVAMTGPIGIAVMAVLVALYAFRDKLAGYWQNIINFFHEATNRIVAAFYKLPEGVQNAMLAVVRVVRDAAMAVYEWFSYLNPFARHSPSLVENVTNGMAAVNRQFGTITQIKGPIDAAYGSIARLKGAMGALGDNLEFASKRTDIAEINPSALGAFDGLVATLSVGRARMDALSGAVKRQEAVVKVWEQRLKAANDALEAQRDKLSDLQEVADNYSRQISDLNAEISTLASTPITGMRAMEDAIFANEMAQKRLRLEMLKAGEQGGLTYDEIRSKIAALAGEIDTLTGTREGLRSMGAGSEILDHYDDQIDALRKQKDALSKAEAPVNKLQDALDKLQREAEIMDLEKALKFDPLTRQIEHAANAMDEMPFDAIISKIRTNQGAIDRLTPAYDAATQAVKDQEAAVKSAEAAVESISASRDAEADKLEVLRDLYQEVADAVRDMESALNDAGSAASAIKQAQEAAAGSEEYVSPALQNFRDAAGGNFADVGGTGGLGREGGFEDQSGLIDDFTKTIADEAAAMFGSFDMFEPVKKWWAKFLKWWDANVIPWWNIGVQFFKDIFKGVDVFGPITDTIGKVDWRGLFTGIWNGIVAVVETVWDVAGMMWDLFGPDIMETFQIITDALSRMWEGTKQHWQDLADRLDPFMDAMGNLWDIVKPILMLIVGGLLFLAEVGWEVFNNVLGPAIDWVGDMFSGLWDIILGVIDMFIGLFTLDFNRFFDGLGGALGGIGGMLWDTLTAIPEIIWGILRGIAGGIWDGFVWLADMMWDGLGTGLDNGIQGIFDWFTGWVGDVIDWVKDLFGIASPSKTFAEIGGDLMLGLLNGVIDGAIAVGTWFLGLPGMIAGWIIDAATWLWEDGFAMIGGFLAGVVQSALDLAAWLGGLGMKVVGWINDAGSWLWNEGFDMLVGFLAGAMAKAEELGTWMGELPAKALEWIGDTTTWLIEKGKDLIQGMIDGIEQKIIDIQTWFTELPGKIETWVGDTITWLYEDGWDMIQGLIDGLIAKIPDIILWFQELPGKIMTWIGETATWLWENGGEIVGGLVQGMIDHGPEIAKAVGILVLILIGAIIAIPVILTALGLALIAGLVKGIYEGMANTLGPKLDELREFVRTKFNEAVDAVVEAWDQMWADIGTEFDTAKTEIMTDWENFKTDTSAKLEGIKTSVTEKWNTMWDIVKGATGTGTADQTSKFETFKNDLSTKFETAKTVLGQKWDTFWSNVKTSTDTATGGQLTKFETWKNDMGLKLEGIKTTLGAKWDQLWESTRTKAQGAIDNLLLKWENFKDSIGQVFDRIKTRVGEVWDGIMEKVKAPIRIVFAWANTNMIDPINTLLGKFPGGLKVDRLPALREGGRLRGPGTGTSDSILGIDKSGVPTARVSNGEFVVNKKSTDANFGLIQAINSAKGKLPGFAGGGVIQRGASWLWDKATNAASVVGDKLGDLIAKGGKFAVDNLIQPLANTVKGMVPGNTFGPTVMRGTIDKLMESLRGKGTEHDKAQASLQGGTFGSRGKTPNGVGGLGPMAAAARAYTVQRWGITNIGGYAQRNIAGTGTVSDHALGKAIDIMIANYKSPGQIALGNQIASHFVANPNQFGTKYVIWRDQINQGRGWQSYGHPGGGRSDTLQHRDHVHLSVHDRGGILDGIGVNLSGKPERVLSPRQTIAFDRLVNILDREGAPSIARLEAAIFRAEAKMMAVAAIGSRQQVVKGEGETNNTYNFYGNLEFPNITNGEDADVFIKNLGDLAPGRRGR